MTTDDLPACSPGCDHRQATCALSCYAIDDRPYSDTEADFMLSEMLADERERDLPEAFRPKVNYQAPDWGAHMQRAMGWVDGYNAALQATKAADLWREVQRLRNLTAEAEEWQAHAENAEVDLVDMNDRALAAEAEVKRVQKVSFDQAVRYSNEKKELLAAGQEIYNRMEKAEADRDRLLAALEWTNSDEWMGALEKHIGDGHQSEDNPLFCPECDNPHRAALAQAKEVDA